MTAEIQPPNIDPAIFLKDHGIDPINYPKFPQVAETLAEVFYLDTEIGILNRLRTRKLDTLYKLVGFEGPNWEMPPERTNGKTRP